MKKNICVLAVFMLFGLFFQSCGTKPDIQELKRQVQQKVFAALKCDSNSDITGVKINSFSKDTDDNTYSFVGSYVGKLGFKYEGKVNGIAIFKDKTIVLQLVHFETKITSGDISYTCLN